MWRRSWLSREVLMFSLFSAVAGLYAGLLFLRLPGSSALGALTALCGATGVTASACIYVVRARPAWNSKHTLAEFYLTAALLGPLFAISIGVGQPHWLIASTVVAAALQLLNQATKFFWLSSSDTFEARASAKLLSTRLASPLLWRGALLVTGGIALPLFMPTELGACMAFVLAFAGEILGRYLFFVSVVPKNMAASYLSSGKAAA